MNEMVITRYVVQFRTHANDYWRDYTTGGGWCTEVTARRNMPAQGENGQEYRLVKRVSTDTEV